MKTFIKSADIKSIFRLEIKYLAKYFSIGVINTILGFAVIYFAMNFGFSPVASNTFGYGFGLVVSFIFSKKIVFLSEKNFVKEAIYFFIAFIISFSINILVLQLIIYCTNLELVFAQLFAIVSYSLTMYLLSRFFVFRSTLKS